jgi:thioredoxin reductase (NADPH)
MSVREVVIIGSGPAGYTAGIYAARAMMNPLMYEGIQAGGTPGGQLMLTTEVENFPGFEHGVMGPDLMGVMRKQALRFGLEIKSQDVTRVDFSRRPFTIETAKESAQAKSVIIATGARSKMLGLPEEKQVGQGGLFGAGISTCATCDGAFFRDADLIVVGGGDSAMEEANFLTRFAKTVTLVHRRSEFRASKIMVDRAKNNPKIRFVLDSTITKVADIAKGSVTGATLINLKTQATQDVKVDGIFVAIGHSPNTELFKGQIDLDGDGYIVARGSAKALSATNIPGVFAAGDCVDHVYRQAITAAGMGCQAALDAERYVAHEGAHETAGAQAAASAH